MSSSSSPPAPGGGPEPSPSLAGLSLSSQISGGVGGSGGGGGGGGGSGGRGGPGGLSGLPLPLPLPLPAVGARVRCEGLTEFPHAAALNGYLGRVVAHAPGPPARARVQLDGPVGRVVGVMSNNLVAVLGLPDLLQVSRALRMGYVPSGCRGQSEGERRGYTTGNMA